MGWQEAQLWLTWISVGLGCVGFFGAILFYLRVPNEFDWAERLARALFMWLQCALWSAVVAFVVMALCGVDFGGVKK